MTALGYILKDYFLCTIMFTRFSQVYECDYIHVYHEVLIPIDCMP